MPYILKSNDPRTIKTYTIGLNKTDGYDFDTAELDYVFESDTSGADTVQFVFTRDGSLYRLTFGRSNVTYQINGITMWAK